MSAVDHQLTGVEIAVMFGGLTALSDLSFELREREILGLIGPNGAGKTTLVNVLTGFQRPSGGRVLISGRDVTGFSPRAISRAGIARTFQNVRLFRGLSVLENLEAAGVAAGMRSRQARSKACDLLHGIHLTAKAKHLANSLSYAEERLLGIARALMTGASFLLLDEPAAGMTDVECDELVHFLAGFPANFKCAVMIIEHNMQVVMNLCDRIQVIENGRTIAVGAPSAIRANTSVIEAYLGRRAVKS